MLKGFYSCIVVSLENVITDIAEMEKGMEMTKREYEARKDRDPPVILKDFLANSEDKIKKLRVDAKSAQVRHLPRMFAITWSANRSFSQAYKISFLGEYYVYDMHMLLSRMVLLCNDVFMHRRHILLLLSSLERIPRHLFQLLSFHCLSVSLKHTRYVQCLCFSVLLLV